MATTKKPKRGRLFYSLIRTRFTTALVREHGYDRADARELADHLTDQDIDQRADAQKVGAVGDGGFLDWLADHQEQIRALVEFLVSLFALVAVAKPVTPDEPPADAAV